MLPASAILIATADLSLIQAIRTADRLASRNAAGSRDACDRADVTFEPRQVVHPEPRYEPRPVRTDMSGASNPPAHRSTDDLPPPPIDASATGRSSHNPIQPPWKVLNYNLGVAPAGDRPIQKITLRRIEGWPAGAMIDLFC